MRKKRKGWKDKAMAVLSYALAVGYGFVLGVVVMKFTPFAWRWLW